MSASGNDETPDYKPYLEQNLFIDACAAVFPYGNVKFTIQDGGMVAPRGVAIERLGDKHDDMVVV
jgi:uncharacterized protein (TIGR02058 family)